MPGIRFFDNFEPPRARPRGLPLPGFDFDEATHHEEMLFGRNYQRRNELRRDWVQKKGALLRKQLKPKQLRERRHARQQRRSGRR